MWARLEYTARKWSGARSKKASGGILKLLEKRAPEIANARTRKARRTGAIAWFAEQKDNAERNIARDSRARRGCQIIQDIAEAVQNKGEVIVKIFDAVHAAAKGVDKGSKVTTVYREGGRKAMQWVVEARTRLSVIDATT